MTGILEAEVVEEEMLDEKEGGEGVAIDPWLAKLKQDEEDEDKGGVRPMAEPVIEFMYEDPNS